MAGQDYIVLRIDADLDRVARQRDTSPRRRRRGADDLLGGALSTEEVLVARPSGVPVEEYVSIEKTSLSERQASEARRDPKNLVAPSMPVTLIEPMSAEDAGLNLDGDPLEEAKAARVSWGVESVLGASATDLTGAGVKVAVLDTG